MAKGVIGSGKKAAKDALETATDQAPSPSPNPMTNLILADFALRSGGQLLQRAVEHVLLDAKNSGKGAGNLAKRLTRTQTLVGSALARIASRSVPGALVIGGGLLAKTLYDRRRGKAAARSGGSKAIAKQAEKGADEA